MIAAILGAVLAAADVEQVVSVVPEHPTVAVYTSPTAIVGLAAVSAVSYSGPVLFLPVGATFALAENWGVSAEVSFSVAPLRAGVGWSLGASLGPTWLPSRRGVEGWFVNPKLAVQISSMPEIPCPCRIAAEGNHGPLDLGPGVSRAFLIGLDAGYTFHTSPVSFGLVLGAAVGYQYDGWSYVSPFSSTLGNWGSSSPFSDRPQGLAFTFNLSLVRLGWSG